MARPSVHAFLCTPCGNVMLRARSLDVLSLRCSFAAIVFAQHAAKMRIIYEEVEMGTVYFDILQKKTSPLPSPCSLKPCDLQPVTRRRLPCGLFVDGFWLA